MNIDFLKRILAREREPMPESNSATVVEAANFLIWCSFINLHNELLRDYLIREILVILELLRMVKLTPEEAHAIAEKWKDLPEMTAGYDVRVKEILNELSNR